MQLVAYWAPLNLYCCLLHFAMPCHASLNQTCIILACASCHAYVMVVYHVVCFFPMLLLSSSNVVIVRTRSTTSVRLLHGLVLLPSGISGKMTATLDLTTIIAMLVALFYHYAALPITCSSSLPNCHEPLTFETIPSKPLFGYVTALLSPSYSVVSCRWSWRFLHGGQDYVGIS